jgi:hypothetical protein
VPGAPTWAITCETRPEAGWDGVRSAKTVPERFGSLVAVLDAPFLHNDVLVLSVALFEASEDRSIKNARVYFASSTQVLNDVEHELVVVSPP